MTEAEWLGSDDPRPMGDVALKSARASERTCRLFVAAFWGWQALRLPEPQGGGLLQRVNVVAEWAETGEPPKGVAASARPGIFHCSDAPAALTQTVRAPNDEWWTDWREALREQSRLLRDIFGNPFRTVAFSPSWRTDTAVALARQMYEGRDFSAMPILADALQDAGCDSEEILNHSRGPNVHVRGCWVVDLLLGRE